MVSVIQGHKNPFADHLLAYSEAQLDFILEMESIDNPERISFSRSGSGAAITDIMAAWDRVLSGPAKEGYYGESLMKAIRRTASKKKMKQPRLGIVRGRKP